MHRVVRAFIILSALIVFFSSCEKEKETAGSNTPNNPIVTPTPPTGDASEIRGTYIGITREKYLNQAAQGTFSDSSERADTFVIKRVEPDSFIISRPDWEIAKPAMLYVTDTTTYFRTHGQAAFNDQLIELTIRFNAAHDSIYVLLHEVIVSSNMLQRWTEFKGRKH